MAAGTQLPVNAGGSLILNPANHTGPDYGGTILATVHAARLTPIEFTDPIDGEDHGGDEVEAIYLRREWVFTFASREVNEDAWRLAFPAIQAGVGTSIPRLSDPSSTQLGGELVSSWGNKLLWAPEDVVLPPGFVIRNAVPRQVDVMDFSGRDELILVVTLRGFRDASDDVISLGKVDSSNLAL